MSLENLPKEWRIVNLGNTSEQITKGTTPTTLGFDYQSEGIPFVKIENINENGINMNSISQYISETANAALQRSQLQIGDILFTIAGTIGKTALVTEKNIPANTNQAVAIIRGTKKIFEPKYLRQQLREASAKIAKNKARGGAMNNISLEDLKGLNMSLPPLAEQKEIAVRLDSLLAQVDTIKTRIDRIPAIIKKFRQSVLSAAVTGKLTEEWRKGKKYPKFKTHEKELSEFRDEDLLEIPSDWQWLRFDSVAKVASNLRDPLLTPDAFHIAPNNIESKTGILLEYKTVKEDNVFSSKHKFFSGQILYSKIRPYLCKVVIVNFEGLCSADMYPINTEMNTKYLFRWMLSYKFTEWASNAESRSVLPKINQKDLGKIPIPVPPLPEQHEIVRRVEELFAFADIVEARVKEAQKRMNTITQSILAKAFRGDLTQAWRTENPDLITGENSAEKLLERIKSEKVEKKKS